MEANSFINQDNFVFREVDFTEAKVGDDPRSIFSIFV